MGEWSGRSGQILRVSFGVGLLTLAAVVYGPDLVGTRSTNAIVNARAVVVLSPIEGVIAHQPPSAGTSLHAGDVVAEIRNTSTDQAFLIQLRTEMLSLRARAEALAQLQNDLSMQLEHSERDRNRSLDAAVARLESMVKEGDAAARAAAATARDADREVRRKQTLFASGAVSRPAVDMAVNAADHARAEADRALYAAARLSHDLAAVRSGSFVGTEAADSAYAQRRADDIALRLAEVAAQLRETRARIVESERALPIEEGRIGEKSIARLVSPIDGIVWQPATFSGGWVAANRPVVTVIDCSEPVVQARLPGRSFETVYPGMTASVRVLGSDRVWRGVVRDLRGMGASEQFAFEQSDRFAAPAPVIAKDEFLVTLALLGEPETVGSDRGNTFCNVGRHAEVAFDEAVGPLGGVLHSVAQWAGFTEAVAADGSPGAAGRR